MKIKTFILFILLSCSPALGWAQTAPPEVVQARLVAETTAIESGKPFRLGVLLDPKPGWHTYWKNPGDAGLPTAFEWTLPKDFAVSAIDWPPPRQIKEGPLTTYGFDGKVFLPVIVTTPETMRPSAVYAFHVTARWLVCKDICIPESATLTVSLPAGQPAPSDHAPLFTAHDQQKPVMVAQQAAYHVESDRLVISVPLAMLGLKNGDIADALFFPHEPNVTQYAAAQHALVENDTLHLTIARAEGAAPDYISGVLAINGVKHFDIQLAAVISAAPATPAPAAIAPAVEPAWLPVTLLLAFVGGLILNLMPCVLPVLSLKVLAVVKKSSGDRRHALTSGIAYTLGILMSFAGFAALLLALKGAGEAVGWGYQMQSPAFVGFLIYLLFFIGLSLSGVFHLPVLLGNIGSDITDRTSAKSSFLTGILATAVATPCTAPFMASAVGAALVLPDWQAMLVFLTLGLGLASPFLLISLFPQLLKFLPKPGAWMETFKQLLAFPMYASVIWLLWVLTLQSGTQGMLLALSGLLLIVLALWMKRLFSNEIAYRLAAVTLLAAALGWSLGRMEMLGEYNQTPMMPVIEQEMGGVATASYSPAALNDLRAQGKPVFVNATAAWCITCQFNARTAIHKERVQQAFAERGVTLMIADWTRRNPDITEFLAEFGYRGVPLYVFYPTSGGAPKVLPQLLTEDIVIDAISQTP